MPFALTTEQEAVISNRGGGLLVSAAAGSGKTRVLVERLLTRVTGEDRNVDEFLIITYTRAAAAELRGRIAQGLSDRLGENPQDAHMRRQATLVYKAQISTVHAFCAGFLRECGHLLDLSPDFHLCDEGEAGVLMERALSEVLEKRYDNLNPESGFAFLLDTMSAGRDDSRLAEIVLDIYHRVQSHPDPHSWLAGQEAAFRAEELSDAGETVWGRLLLDEAKRQCEYWRGRVARALELTGLDEKLTKAYAPSLSETHSCLSAFASAAGRDWDQAVAAASGVLFPRLGQVRGGCDHPEVQERVKAIREACKKRMAKLAELFREPSAVLLEDIRTVHPAVRALFALVEDFSDAYAAEKKRRNLLDFSDLEHFTVRLLTNEEGKPTELAGEWSRRFTEIMVDEYQDTNEVQNAIFTALSRQGQNLFLVGDVKQSIYRFRLADPTIFLSKYRSFLPYTKAMEGQERYITLSKNFRSRPEVLKSVNQLFFDLMSSEFGEMDYNDEEALYPGGNFPSGRDYRAELDVLDCGDREEGEEGKTDKNLLEARFVARRICQLTQGELEVSDGAGGLRPARPEDVVILLRSPGSSLHHYVRALAERGLSWRAEGAEDFFAATEVMVALSLLQIVDNPRQDVALLAALRSPVWGFSADRLAQLRAGCEGDFYTALLLAAEQGEKDCRDFLKELDRLRFGAADRTSNQIIWNLYERTNLMGIFGVMPGGSERQGNLLTLYELARRFEGTGHRGLFGFLSHLARLREAGVRITPPGKAGDGGGVSILSIHRSKGLEFPVVFLCGLSKRFNRDDLKKPVLFHPKLGLGPRGLDRERMVEYPTLPRLAVARQLEAEMMAEELRLLYVAMTRAQEKLILTYTLGTGSDELRNLREDAGSPVEPQALSSCSSVGQWVLLSVMNCPEAKPLRQAAGMGGETACDGRTPEPVWDVRLIHGTEYEATEIADTSEEEPTQTHRYDEELLLQLSWVNPHAMLADVPSKLTATQLKGRYMDEEAAQETDTRRRRALDFHRPGFAQKEFGLTAAQQGTALHLALQYLDFAKTDSEADIREEIQRMVGLALLTPQQGEAVSPRKIFTFFDSPLGREVKAAAQLRREFKFSVLMPAEDYYPGSGTDEQILLQGVIDCWFENEHGITVLDFKTDNVSENSVSRRAEEYRAQITAYSRALKEITGKQIARSVLWFFALNQAVWL